MTKQEKKECLSYFQRYRNDIQKDCDYWCDTCVFGIMLNSCNGYSCPFDLIVTQIENEVYE